MYISQSSLCIELFWLDSGHFDKRIYGFMLVVKYKINICSHQSHFSLPHFSTTRHCDILELDHNRRYNVDGSDNHTCTGCDDGSCGTDSICGWQWRCSVSTSADSISLLVVLRWVTLLWGTLLFELSWVSLVIFKHVQVPSE